MRTPGYIEIGPRALKDRARNGGAVGFSREYGILPKRERS